MELGMLVQNIAHASLEQTNFWTTHRCQKV